MRVCRGCGQDKPLIEFYLSEGRPRGRCKACVIEANAASKTRESADPVRRAARQRVVQRAQRKYKYKITQDRYDELVAAQDGRCCICDREAPLQVDHCHVTGDVRFLLCGNCNKGLGLFGDDIERLEAAIRYLQVSRGQVSGAQ